MRNGELYCCCKMYCIFDAKKFNIFVEWNSFYTRWRASRITTAACITPQDAWTAKTSKDSHQCFHMKWRMEVLHLDLIHVLLVFSSKNYKQDKLLYLLCSVTLNKDLLRPKKRYKARVHIFVLWLMSFAYDNIYIYLKGWTDSWWKWGGCHWRCWVWYC